MLLKSPAFASGQRILERYTCDGANVSPPLQWSRVPAATRSLALIVEDPDAPDPDAPKTTWTHWVLYNIPPTVMALPEDTVHAGLPPGTLEGLNDWSNMGYSGPCPPIGRHRYFHRLYALSELLPDLAHPQRSALLHAMHGKVIAETSLMGLYARSTRR